MAKEQQQEDAVIIKKYANRRLYNTDTSTYVTLDDLCQMVKDGADFIVYDAKTGDDITRQILTQIIFEQESRGQNLLPISFLRSLIGFYDDRISEIVPHYLDSTMQTFSNNQERMREYVGQTMSGYSPLSQFEEISKQNMALFTRAFQMFTPFGVTPTATDKPRAAGSKK